LRRQVKSVSRKSKNVSGERENTEHPPLTAYTRPSPAYVLR
jgi:hypothetical protein